LKVALVNQPFTYVTLPDLAGSVEIITYELAKRLAKQYEVTIYSMKGHHQDDFEAHEGVLHRRIPAGSDEKFIYLGSGIDRRLTRTRFNTLRHPLHASRLCGFMYALRVAKDLQSEKCDIVHIQNYSQFVPIIKMFNPKIKIAIHMHCEWLTQLNQKMIRRRLSKTDLIIGPSQYITEKNRHTFPQFAERCQTLYNGVSADFLARENGQEMRKKNDTKHLLFVGRVSPEKGVHVLLDAFARVVKCYPQVHLTIVGVQKPLPFELLVGLSDDPKTSKLASFYAMNYMSYLRKVSSEIGHVSFVGPIPHRLLINYLRNSDVVVLPSVCNEAFGMPALEAMATGVTVVATNSGGVPEIVSNGETGLIVERDDASALAEAILRLLSDEDLRKSMGNAAHERVVKIFSWEQITKNLMKLYEDMQLDH
jgi:glycosyltransferase involved in cell wall biosynthesis